MIRDHAERIDFRVTNLGNTNIFLGLDWLFHHNPNIDWSNSTLSFDHCPAKCGYVPWWYSPEEGEVLNRLDEDDCLFLFDWEGYVHDHGHIRTVKTKVNDYINDYPEVFNKKGFDELPPQRPWDHAIELTPRSKPVDCKVYPLNLDEQKALDKFLEENLHQKERWCSPTGPGLPKTEQHDHQKPVSISFDPGTYRQA